MKKKKKSNDNTWTIYILLLIIASLVKLAWNINEYLGYFATVIGVLFGILLLATDDKNEEEKS